MLGRTQKYSRRKIQGARQGKRQARMGVPFNEFTLKRDWVAVYSPEVPRLWFEVEYETAKDFREYVIWFARQESVFKTVKTRSAKDQHQPHHAQ